MTLRVNTRTARVEACRENSRLPASLSRHCLGLGYGAGAGAAGRRDALPGFAEGEISVQDAGAQYAAPLLDAQAGERVLDACAAPGGKTGHLLERTPGLGELVAVDIDAERLARVPETLSAWAVRDPARPTLGRLVGRAAIRSHPARRALLGHRRHPPPPGHQAAAPSAGAFRGTGSDATRDLEA